jgi:hypothetical protein
MSRSADLVPLAEALKGTIAVAAAAPVAPVAAARPAAAPAEAEPVADAEEPVPLAAAAPPAPAPAFTGTPTTAEEAQSAWPRVVAAIREKSLLCATILKEGRVAKLSADEIAFSLPSKFNDSHLRQLDNPKNKAAIEAGLQSVFGRKMALRASLEAGGSAAAPRPVPARPADTTADPGVKKILEAFGGSKVVGIE